MIITGTIIKSHPVKNISDRFKIRPLSIEVKDGDYTQKGTIQFVNKNIDAIYKTLKPNTLYDFHVNISGNNEDYSFNLNCWKAVPSDIPQKRDKVTVSDLEDGDDLPF